MFYFCENDQKCITHYGWVGWQKLSNQTLFQKAKENQVLWPQLHNVPKQVLPFPAPNLFCPAQPRTAQPSPSMSVSVFFIVVLLCFNQIKLFYSLTWGLLLAQCWMYIFNVKTFLEKKATYSVSVLSLFFLNLFLTFISFYFIISWFTHFIN